MHSIKKYFLWTLEQSDDVDELMPNSGVYEKSPCYRTCENIADISNVTDTLNYFTVTLKARNVSQDRSQTLSASQLASYRT
jgi:hypothetical protein